MLISIHGLFRGGPGGGSCVLSGVQVKCLCGPCTISSYGHSTRMEFMCQRGASVRPAGWELVLRWFKKLFLTLFPKKKKKNSITLLIYSCCAGALLLRRLPLVAVSGGCSLWSADSVVGAHRLSCCAARGVFLHQGWNPHLLHQQADSLPLSHQESAHFPDLTLHI